MPDPNNVLLRQHGIAYMGICKAANSSIKLALLRSMGLLVDWGDEHKPHYFEYVDAAQVARCDLWTFAIVRDPFTRLVSCWRNKIMGPGWKDSLRPRWGLCKGMAFESFVDAVCAISDEQSFGFGQHWRSQAYDLVLEGRLVPDYIGRYEALDEAWQTVRSRSRLLLPALPHVNGTDRPRVTWTQALAEKVRRRYRADCALFGY